MGVRVSVFPFILQFPSGDAIRLVGKVHLRGRGLNDLMTFLFPFLCLLSFTMMPPTFGTRLGRLGVVCRCMYSSGMVSCLVDKDTRDIVFPVKVLRNCTLVLPGDERNDRESEIRLYICMQMPIQKESNICLLSSAPQGIYIYTRRI